MPPPAGREMPPRKRELPGLGAGASEFHPPSPRNWSSASGQGSRRGGESTGVGWGRGRGHPAHGINDLFEG